MNFSTASMLQQQKKKCVSLLQLSEAFCKDKEIYLNAMCNTEL